MCCPVSRFSFCVADRGNAAARKAARAELDAKRKAEKEAEAEGKAGEKKAKDKGKEKKEKTAKSADSDAEMSEGGQEDEEKISMEQLNAVLSAECVDFAAILVSRYFFVV